MQVYHYSDKCAQRVPAYVDLGVGLGLGALLKHHPQALIALAVAYLVLGGPVKELLLNVLHLERYLQFIAHLLSRVGVGRLVVGGVEAHL